MGKVYEAATLKFQECSRCRLIAYCGPECQRLNWAEDKLSCKRHAVWSSRAEETSLAKPLGEAFFLDSTSRWRDEVWLSAYERILNSFLFTPSKEPDLAVVSLEFSYDPSAATLVSQWRPRAHHHTLTISPLSSIEPRIVPKEISDNAATLHERDSPRMDPEGRLWGPWRIMKVTHSSPPSEKGVAKRIAFGFNRVVCRAPCARDPANVNLDWVGAVFSFLQSTDPSLWSSDDLIEKHIATYLSTRQNDAFGTLASALGTTHAGRTRVLYLLLFEGAH
ncbi:hypothetical protein RQP46_002400 [Phenoliferia psychrophenolica]